MARKTIREIDYETLKRYWIEVDHFQDPNKKIIEIIKYLGPHVTPYTNPRRIAYGLYDKNELIGVTQLVQWNETHIRYRTLNIRKQYRGQGLGWFLLLTSYNRHWKGSGNLFGWVIDTHYKWAINHGFRDLDKQWTNDHIAMERIM